MNLRLSGLYIHLDYSGKLDAHLQECLNAFLSRLQYYCSSLQELPNIQGPFRIVSNHSLFQGRSILLKENPLPDGGLPSRSPSSPDSLGDSSGPALSPDSHAIEIEVLDLAEHPYRALKSLFSTPEPSPEDLQARMETWALFQGLAPLMDLEIALDLLNRHGKFLSSYTYAENLPAGMSPDYVGRDLFSLEKEPDGDLRSFVFKNFHELDAEVAFYQPDLRLHRLELNAANHRSLHLCSRLLDSEMKDGPSLKKLASVLEKQPGILHISPSYLEVELTTSSPVKDRLLLDPGPPTALSRENRTLLLKQLDDLIEKDVTVCLGGLGDSGSDPEAPEYALSLLSHPSVAQVFVETYGYHMQHWMEALKKNRDQAFQLSTSTRLVFLVRIASLREDRYDHFYSGGELSRVLAALEDCQAFLKEEKSAGFSLYVEMQKIREVEDEIHDFFRKYDSTLITPILRKQNTYGGRLEDRKLADLSPPVRGFCWHLARDLYINAAGHIPVCRQVPKEKGPSLHNGLLEVFQQREGMFVHSMRGEHERIPAPCVACDEWYLFQA